MSRKISFVAALCAAFLLVACGDKNEGKAPETSAPAATPAPETTPALGTVREDTDLKVFVDFLQEHVLKAEGSNLPYGKAIDLGKYAAHYQVIVDFHDDMAETVQQTRQKLDERAGGSWENARHFSMEKQEQIFGYWQELLWKADTRMEQALVRAEINQASLRQPDALKSVYAEAFDRKVRQPREKIAQAVRLTNEAHDKVKALLNFGAKHLDPNVIRYNDIKDLELRRTLRKLEQDQKEAIARAREIYRARDFPYVFSKILP